MKEEGKCPKNTQSLVPRQRELLFLKIIPSLVQRHIMTKRQTLGNLHPSQNLKSSINSLRNKVMH